LKRRVFVSNCEGLISKNNSTLELTSHFVPEGDRIYNIINRYSYLLSNFSNMKEFETADSLKLILPFLLAYDANNKNVEEFCASKLVFVKNSRETLGYVKKTSDAFIVGSSLEHHARAVCRESNFPLENTYFTKVNLDRFELSAKDKAKLKTLAWEIGGMPQIKIPLSMRSLQDLAPDDQATISRLDKILWKEVPKANCKRVYSETKVVGASAKIQIIKQLGKSLAYQQDLMYVGNDPTDVPSMEFVKSSGGFSISFNGTQANVKNADVVIDSDDYSSVAVLADLFGKLGKGEAERIAGNFEKDVLWMTSIDPILLDGLFALEKDDWPKLKIVTPYNVAEMVNQAKKITYS
jgi:energy-converting hydrogenase A subunit R